MLSPLQGKKVKYSVEVHEVREKKAPDPKMRTSLNPYKLKAWRFKEES